MSDSKRRFRAIRQALNTIYPDLPTGNKARHLNTLASMICGIVGSKSVQLPKIAKEVTEDTKPESRVMKYRRFVQNEDMGLDLCFLPYIAPLLSGVGIDQVELILSIDTSTVGRGCLVLMVSLVYKQRAIPLCWSVTRQKKGHLSADTHLEVIKMLHEKIPEGIKVTLLGDGEFDRVAILETLIGYGWHYAIRTAKNAYLLTDGAWILFNALIPSDDERYRSVRQGHFTQEALVGPLQAICYWDRRFKDPLYLLTDFASVDTAMTYYRKRAKIETFFSDQKSRGFHIHKSHMSDPDRIKRLLIAACLAYIWIIYLGNLADKQGYRSMIERTDRADLSLFQLGLGFLAHVLNHDLPVSVAFQFNLIVPQPFIKNVR